MTAEELDPEEWGNSHEDHWSDDWDILNAQIRRFAEAYHKHKMEEKIKEIEGLAEGFDWCSGMIFKKKAIEILREK